MLIVVSGCVNLDKNLINCNEDYDCLYEQVSQGNSAKVTLTEEVESLNIIEKSEVKVEPINNQFKVTMTVLELEKIPQERARGAKSIVEAISETCPQIVDNLNKVELTSAICVVNSPEEAKELAIKGLSEETIEKYSCEGNLINAIQDICVTPSFPNFPPGAKKPAVYLYPTQKSQIDVSVDVKGFITKSEPAYLTGWSVVAEPNGLIDEQYDYLFYEAQLKQLEIPEEGWIVEYSNLETWFDANLKQLGLNEKEIFQFKEYWLNELPKSDYYEIRLIDNDFLRENMDLIVEPEPDTIIRRIFYFKPISQKIELSTPTIETPLRAGFVVVEWGGLLA